MYILVILIKGTCGKNYMYAGLGRLCQKIGNSWRYALENGENIHDWEECKDAANELGKTFSKTINDANLPFGCLVYWDESNNNISLAFFNNNTSSSRNEKANPICIRKRKGKYIK